MYETEETKETGKRKDKRWTRGQRRWRRQEREKEEYIVIEETWETRGMEARERIQKGESGDKDIREYKDREAIEETRRRHI